MNFPGGNFTDYPSTAYRPRIRFEAIGEAFQLFGQQMGTWVLALFIAAVIYLGVYFGGVLLLILLGVAAAAVTGQGHMHSDVAGAGLIGGMIFGYLALFVLIGFTLSYLGAGLFRMAVRQVRGEYISIGDLFTGLDGVLPVLGASVLIGLASAIAHVTLIGGFVLLGLWMLTIPLIVDRGEGVLDAMGDSWNALKSEWVMAALFNFVLMVVASAGVILLGVGMLFTYPILFLGTAIVYRDFFPAPISG